MFARSATQQQSMIRFKKCKNLRESPSLKKKTASGGPGKILIRLYTYKSVMSKSINPFIKLSNLLFVVIVVFFVLAYIFFLGLIS